MGDEELYDKSQKIPNVAIWIIALALVYGLCEWFGRLEGW